MLESWWNAHELELVLSLGLLALVSPFWLWVELRDRRQRKNIAHIVAEHKARKAARR